MRNFSVTLLFSLALSLLLASAALAYQPGGLKAESKPSDAPAEGVILSGPGFVLSRSAGIESIEFDGQDYSDYQLEGRSASFVVSGADFGSGSMDVPRSTGVKAGMSKLSWEPAEGGGTKVSIDFARAPQYSVVNAMTGTQLHPDSPQVLAAFSFGSAGQASGPDRGGQRETAAAAAGRRTADGDYDLPKFPPYKYSDALVTLRANNVDFREVLWLFSRIGNVSIMLDPYWGDEPTGTRRPPGGGVQYGAGGGPGSGAGFRGAGDFGPIGLTEGAGKLSFNFVDVPFDTALDLVIKSVGLVYVDITPEGEHN